MFLLSSSACCRIRPVFRLWRATPRTSLVLASTQSCPSSSLDQRMVSSIPTPPYISVQKLIILWPHLLWLHATLPPPFVGTVRIWHSSTYRLESTLNYGMERVWCVCGLRGSNNVALGYDEGSIIIKVSAKKCNILKKHFYEFCKYLSLQNICNIFLSPSFCFSFHPSAV